MPLASAVACVGQTPAEVWRGRYAAPPNGQRLAVGGDHQSQKGSAPFGSDCPHGSEQFLEGFAAHWRRCNCGAGEPCCRERSQNLKILLARNADADLKPFKVRSASSTSRTGSLRPTTMMGLRSALAVGVQGIASPLPLPKKLFDIDPPEQVVADDLRAGEPHSSLGTIWGENSTPLREGLKRRFLVPFQAAFLHSVEQ